MLLDVYVPGDTLINFFFNFFRFFKPFFGGFMKRRSHVKKSKSRRLFSKTAGRTHKRNIHSQPMRGGIRL